MLGQIIIASRLIDRYYFLYFDLISSVYVEPKLPELEPEPELELRQKPKLV